MIDTINLICLVLTFLFTQLKADRLTEFFPGKSKWYLHDAMHSLGNDYIDSFNIKLVSLMMKTNPKCGD